MNLGNDIYAIDEDLLRSSGARKATCRTARCSVTLIFSPREHGVDVLAQAGFLRKVKKQAEGLVRNPIFREVEVQTQGLQP